MSELSLEIMETARKNEQIILQYLSKVKQSNVASALSTSESAKGYIKYLCGTDISESAPPIQHEPNIFQLKKLTEEKKGFSLKEKNNGTI